MDNAQENGSEKQPVALMVIIALLAVAVAASLAFFIFNPFRGGENIPEPPEEDDSGGKLVQLEPTPVEWRSGLEEALEDASTSGKPVMAWFYSPRGCPICPSLEQVFTYDPEFVAIIKKVVPYRVPYANFDLSPETRELQNKYGPVKQCHAIIFINPDGTEIGRTYSLFLYRNTLRTFKALAEGRPDDAPEPEKYFSRNLPAEDRCLLNALGPSMLAVLRDFEAGNPKLKELLIPATVFRKYIAEYFAPHKEYSASILKLVEQREKLSAYLKKAEFVRIDPVMCSFRTRLIIANQRNPFLDDVLIASGNFVIARSGEKVFMPATFIKLGDNWHLFALPDNIAPEEDRGWQNVSEAYLADSKEKILALYTKFRSFVRDKKPPAFEGVDGGIKWLFLQESEFSSPDQVVGEYVILGDEIMPDARALAEGKPGSSSFHSNPSPRPFKDGEPMLWTRAEVVPGKYIVVIERGNMKTLNKNAFLGLLDEWAIDTGVYK